MAVSILKYRIISVNARSPDAGRGPAAVHFQESAAGFHKNQLQASKSERFGRENRFTPTYATAPGDGILPKSESNFDPENSTLDPKLTQMGQLGSTQVPATYSGNSMRLRMRLAPSMGHAAL